MSNNNCGTGWIPDENGSEGLNDDGQYGLNKNTIKQMIYLLVIAHAMAYKLDNRFAMDQTYQMLQHLMKLL